MCVLGYVLGVHNCTTGVRADPLPNHSLEMVQLELHLAIRTLGLPVEPPREGMELTSEQ